MFSSDRPSWRNPKVLATLVLVFLAGSCVGAMVMGKVVHRSPPVERISFEQLRTKLSLTPDQAQKIETILNDFVKYDQELQRQIEDYRATGRNQIVELLTPEQKRIFLKLSQEVMPR